ncbi:MAG: M3 family metallopeptidase [Acidobacteria bacterium]|jgi:peptidyl-dipeptidase Dcp|nr:M3 family metallopeptidase [Acidobacteriota bacterium]
MRTWLAVAALTCVSLPLTAAAPEAGTVYTNPLLQEWTTPFGVPPFDEIENEHFRPAFDAGLAEARQEIEAIAGSAEPPTFENTVEALELSGELLGKVDRVFSNLNSAETNEVLQAVAKEVRPLQAALNDDIYLNEALFQRVRTLIESRDTLSLDAEATRLLEETFKEFVRSGATLAPEEKTRLREINQELSVLTTRFGENLLAETNAFKLVVDDPKDLAGLPDRLVAGAAEAASEAGLEETWVFTLHRPSIEPFLDNADNRDLRRQILDAYLARGANGNEHDNREVLETIATLRAERARLLGYASHADYVLEDRMAGTPARVREFLDRIWRPSLAISKKEAQALQEAIAGDGGDFDLAAHDWRYYTDRVRRARYALDDSEVRSYFALENVLQGAFTVAHRLYGITFTELHDLPVYHPDVRTFEVKDEDGSHLGIFYADYYPRPGKRGGAWSSRFRSQRMKDGKDIRPVVVNVGNFSRPTGDVPALLSLDEVETLFHELGHGLNSLFSRIRYSGLSTIQWDAVELASQIMENWVLEPEVLKLYARHWKTGEAMPDALVQKLRDARLFNQGYATVEYLAACYLDMDWHTLEKAPDLDAVAFEDRAMKTIGLIPQIPPRYRSPYFAHVFAGGYASGYYGYIWAEVLDADAFAAFQKNGLFDRKTAQSFRRNILERGGTADAMDLWKAFRGREPDVEPLLERRGLK